MSFPEFISLLQMTISPLVMISSIGLLLLSVTNRLSRSIDRARQLFREMKTATADEVTRNRQQLTVLLRRCEILRLSIGLLVGSILMSVAMIVLVIATAFTAIALQRSILLLLIVSVSCILCSVLLFLYDVTLGLKALKIEVRAVEDA